MNEGHAPWPLRVMRITPVLAVLLISSFTQTWAGQPEWPTYGGSFQRTFRSQAVLSKACGMRLDWLVQGDSLVGATNVSVYANVAVRDTLAFLCFWNYLTCFDVRTGAKFWSTARDSFPVFGQDMRCNVTVDDTLIYMGGGGFRAFDCLRVADGSVVWTYNTLSSPAPLGNTKFCPSVIKDSVVYMPTEHQPGEIFAFNKFSGTLYSGWAVNPRILPEGGVFNGFASDGDSLLFVGSAADANTLTDGRLYAVRLADGTIKWALEDPSAKFLDPKLDHEGFSASLAYEDGILYYHSNIRDDASGFDHFPWDGSAGAIDVSAEDGSGSGILWVTNVPVGRALYGGPALGENTVYLNTDGIFISDSNPKGVMAVDKATGSLLWHNPLDSSGVPMPLAVATRTDGMPIVFAGTRHGLWYMLNGQNGDVLWSYQFSGLVHGSVVLDRGILVSTRSSQSGNGNGQLAMFVCDPCFGSPPGDANCNGILDLADVVFLGNVLDGLGEADSCTSCTADLNLNGSLDEEDYELVYDRIRCGAPQAEKKKPQSASDQFEKW